MPSMAEYCSLCASPRPAPPHPALRCAAALPMQEAVSGWDGFTPEQRRELHDTAFMAAHTVAQGECSWGDLGELLQAVMGLFHDSVKG